MKKKLQLLFVLLMISMTMCFASVIPVAAATPAKPTITVVKKSTDTSVWIKWAQAKNAKKYELYCSVDGGAYKRIVTTTKLYYKHTGLTGGKTYSYKLRSINGTNKSQYSAVKTFKLPKPAPQLFASRTSITFDKPNMSKKITITYTGNESIYCFSSDDSIAVGEWTREWNGNDTSLVIKSVGSGTASLLIYDESASCVEILMVTVKTTYGSVSGNITFHYNEFRGYVPDVGATVYLIPKNGSALGYIPKDGIDRDSDSTLLKYNIFRTKVDGNGNYIFDRVPIGSYSVVMVSANSTSDKYFKASDKDMYNNDFANRWSELLSSDAAASLAEARSYYRYYDQKIRVYEGSNTTASYAFPYTYI